MDDQKNSSPYEDYYQNKNQSPKPAKSDKSDGIWWLIIILGFCFGAWPLSIVLIFLKSANKLPNLSRLIDRFAGSGHKTQPPTWQQRDWQAASPGFDPSADPQPKAAATAFTAPAQTKRQKKIRPKRPGYARLLSILGIIVGIIGMLRLADTEVAWDIYNGMWSWVRSDLINYAGEMVSVVGWLISGGILLALGRFQRRKAVRYDQYAQLIGENSYLPIDSIADATGRSYNKICADLQDMIDRGYLPGAWLDLKHRRLMMVEMTVETPVEPKQPEPEPQPEPQSTTSESERILRQIRTANDLIADEEISRKIDRIEALTAKIFKCLEESPEKKEQLTTFLNYYLPQTLKILQLYARLEHQGIEGENIAAAKTRISGMLDKLADGYEKQLDRLFSDEVLDITSDISVMEQMLAKDGLGEEELKPEKDYLKF